MFFLNNSNKMFFYFILIFSTLISISSNSWLGCWIGLEINLMSFIPLISNSNNLMNSESSLKYFLIQSITSINFLFFILMQLIFMENYLFSLMINSSLLMKMGAAPFHFWFPNVMEGMSWLNCFIMMSWQKISPMILLSYIMNKKFLIIIMLLNVIIGSIGGFNQTSLRKLMAFSSINNLGWMFMTLMISDNLWLFYLLLYSFILMLLCSSFLFLNIYFINQIYNFNMNFNMKMFIIINFFSLGGLPPLLGFFPKWITINFLILNKFFIISFIFIMTSLIMLFMYTRMMYSSLLFFNFKLKWFKIFIKNKFTYLINFMNIISLMGIIISSLLYM